MTRREPGRMSPPGPTPSSVAGTGRHLRRAGPLAGLLMALALLWPLSGVRLAGPGAATTVLRPRPAETSPGAPYPRAGAKTQVH